MGLNKSQYNLEQNGHEESAFSSCPRSAGEVRKGVLQASITNARDLRNHPTDAEKILWQHLRLRQIGGCRFRRQRPVGPYIVDFVCLEKKVVIEVDGGQHNERVAYDAKRDDYLRTAGFVVLRFWDHEVLSQIDDVKEAIWKCVTGGPLL
jgi:adenine-specific DNA-methyltransferase